MSREEFNISREEINDNFLPKQAKFYVYLDEDDFGELVFISQFKIDRESGEIELDDTISIYSAMKLTLDDPRVEVLEKYAPYLVRYEVTANLDYKLEEMNMIGKFEYPNADVGKWQLFDGANWRHSFDTLEQAEKYAKKFGAKRIGLVNNNGEHSPQMVIE